MRFIPTFLARLGATREAPEATAYAAQLDANLAARRARRPALSAAAHKGVRTKRAKLQQGANQ